MLILDTNVVSELMRPEPDMAVWVWMSRQAPASLHTTSITFAEILYGLTLLPESRRRQGLLVAVGRIFAEQFQGRILSFDENAAPDYAALMAERRRIGRPMALLDAQIAAIARRQKAIVATRNVKDFEDCGIGVVNPWEL
ncbi:MAG: type II toxin-antitoxin system VapC family toxin [Ferrovibrio sp.]|uniref:type II toxin-antitoxin system VapC family toxin n=1 Tax=Ferrovibrio sp. TaxID=1917215 RepID=UPI00391C9E64